MKLHTTVDGEALPDFEELQAACNAYIAAKRKIAGGGLKHIGDCAAVAMAKIRLVRALAKTEEALGAGVPADAA